MGVDHQEDELVGWHGERWVLCERETPHRVTAQLRIVRVSQRAVLVHSVQRVALPTRKHKVHLPTDCVRPVTIINKELSSKTLSFDILHCAANRAFTVDVFVRRLLIPSAISVRQIPRFSACFTSFLFVRTQVQLITFSHSLSV